MEPLLAAQALERPEGRHRTLVGGELQGGVFHRDRRPCRGSQELVRLQEGKAQGRQGRVPQVPVPAQGSGQGAFHHGRDQSRARPAHGHSARGRHPAIEGEHPPPGAPARQRLGPDPQRHPQPEMGAAVRLLRLHRREPSPFDAGHGAGRRRSRDAVPGHHRRHRRQHHRSSQPRPPAGDAHRAPPGRAADVPTHPRLPRAQRCESQARSPRPSMRQPAQAGIPPAHHDVGGNLPRGGDRGPRSRGHEEEHGTPRVPAFGVRRRTRPDQAPAHLQDGVERNPADGR